MAYDKELTVKNKDARQVLDRLAGRDLCPCNYCEEVMDYAQRLGRKCPTCEIYGLWFARTHGGFNPMSAKHKEALRRTSRAHPKK